MVEKTPVSALTELCVQERVSVPMFESIPHESDPKMFAFIVEAFGIYAKGSGSNKRVARHDACANLMSMLAKMDRFKHKLATVPQAPRPVTETDAIGALLDICVQRSWPLAKFTELQACGQPHAPEFTILCQLAHIKCTGRASTKKGAKQNAAQEMLTFVQNVSLNEDQMQITSVEAEPAERTFRTYRELKNSDIKPKSVRIRNRHNYFLRLPDEDRRAAYRLLKSNSATIGTNKDIVDLVCKALKLRYEIKDIPGHIENNKIFVLLDDFDCVISEKEPILYDRIINYFRTMMV